jgi:hypothetical protein
MDGKDPIPAMSQSTNGLFCIECTLQSSIPKESTQSQTMSGARKNMNNEYVKNQW